MSKNHLNNHASCQRPVLRSHCPTHSHISPNDDQHHVAKLFLGQRTHIRNTIHLLKDLFLQLSGWFTAAENGNLGVVRYVAGEGHTDVNQARIDD